MTETNMEVRDVRILILGPTVRGEFFIADSNNKVWGGAKWRGCAVPKSFIEFRDAWIATTAAKAAHPTLSSAEEQSQMTEDRENELLHEVRK